MVDKVKENIYTGERAKKLLESDEFIRTFEDVRQDIFLLWEKTKSSQEDERERLYREIHGLKAVKHRIDNLVTLGIKAKQKVEDDKREK